MIVPLLLLALMQQAQPSAEPQRSKGPAAKSLPNPNAEGVGRSPLVLAAERAKAERAKTKKPPVKIDQESVRKTTGRITITNPREIPPPPVAETTDRLNDPKPDAPPPPKKNVETRADLEKRLESLRNELGRVSEDAESDSPQEGEQDELGARVARLRAEIDALTERIQKTPR